jgi:ribosomal protein S18 acetylase RimI-like enzyme
MPAPFRISPLRSASGLRAAARRMAGSDPWLKLGLDEHACLRTLSSPGKTTYCAFCGGEPAGHVTVLMSGLLRGYIQILFVPDGFRGHGIGERLLRFAEKEIFRSSPNVFLCVSSFNKGARRFYARLGYKEAGVLKDFLIKGADEVLLRKTKGPLRTFKALT